MFYASSSANISLSAARIEVPGAASSPLRSWYFTISGNGLPAASPDYSFTSGKLSHDGKDVEFSVQVDRFSGRYSVTATELLEIKVRAAKLFAGIDARDLASGASAPPRKDVH